MNDLNDLFSLLAKEKKAAKEKDDIIKENISKDLGSLLGELKVLKSAEKQAEPVEEKQTVSLEPIKENISKDLNSLFAELSSLKSSKKPQPTPIVEEKPLPTPIGEVPKPTPEVSKLPNVDKYLKSPQFQDTPETSASDKEIKLINQKLKFLEQWVGKINNAGPGSGEVNLRYLDDVKRDTIADGRWLKYSEADKKFVFDEINPYEVVYNTTEVTTPTYTVDDNDYYIGVNYAGPVTITLPASANSGRMLIIKDEDGDAETNPITVLGTVDNDVGGFIIQINNGAIQMIYRNGWRIV